MASINKYRRELQTIYDRGVQLGDLVIVSNERFLKLIKMLDDDIGHRLAQRDEDDAALLARLHDALSDQGRENSQSTDSEQSVNDTSEPDLEHLPSDDLNNDIDGDAGADFDPEGDVEPDLDANDENESDDDDYQQASNADTQEDDLINDDGSQTDDDDDDPADDESVESDSDEPSGPDPSDNDPQFDDGGVNPNDDIFANLDGEVMNNGDQGFNAGNFTQDLISKQSQQAAQDFESTHQTPPPVSGSTSVQSSMPSASSSVSQSKPAASSEDSDNRFGDADNN